MEGLTLAQIIATTGILISNISEIVIVLGILLYFFKVTKIFRYGCVGYMIGLLVEIIGSSMM